MRNRISLALCVCLLSGCSPYGRLPANRPPYPLRTIPPDAPGVTLWRADTPVLKTFWGDQSLSLRCRRYFPQAGDQIWHVHATNHQGTTVPFLGVVKRYHDAEGHAATGILPPLKLEKIRDGLYLFIDSDPSPHTAGPRPADITPTALLVEIRDHKLKPFRVTIPLVLDASDSPAP